MVTMIVRKGRNFLYQLFLLNFQTTIDQNCRNIESENLKQVYITVIVITFIFLLTAQVLGLIELENSQT